MALQLFNDDYGIKAGTISRLHNLKELQRELGGVISYGYLAQVVNGFARPTPELMQKIRKVWEKWDSTAKVNVRQGQ